MMNFVLEQFTAVIGPMFKFKPSGYYPLFPTLHEPEYLDRLANEGFFITLDDLMPMAIFWCCIMSLVRVVLQRLFLQNLAMSLMNFKFRDEDSKSVSATQRAINKAHNVQVRKRVTKFIEAAWRAIFYSSFLYFAYIALVPNGEVEPWMYVTLDMWKGWPHHTFSSDFRFFYVLELGCYLHQLLWTEVKRDDAVEMIIHHIVTILLISFSLMCNFLRIGAAIIVLHDSADVFLELAKCFNYMYKNGKRKWASPVCDFLFACFAIVFFYTRLYLYPFYILYSVIYEGPTLGGWWSGLYFYAALLFMLQVLHIFWFSRIATMIYQMFTTGIEKDERSDDEGEEDLVFDESVPATEALGSAPAHGSTPRRSLRKRK